MLPVPPQRDCGRGGPPVAAPGYHQVGVSVPNAEGPSLPRFSDVSDAELSEMDTQRVVRVCVCSSYAISQFEEVPQFMVSFILC
jgi:hypothetical protein